MKLGRGGFGEVSKIYDFDSKCWLAVKSFHNWQAYFEEKRMSEVICDKLSDYEFKNIVFGMAKYEDENKKIYYQLGRMSLHDYIELKLSNKSKISETEIFYIIRTLAR